MIPVDQTRFGGPSAPPEEIGDCFAACMASILEVPLASIPFGLGTTDKWLEPCQEWLALRGLALVCFEVDVDADVVWPKEAWCIISGKSPRGEWDHSTVGRNGQIEHDPHPSRAGLRGVKRQIDMFVVIDPSLVPFAIDRLTELT